MILLFNKYKRNGEKRRKNVSNMFAFFQLEKINSKIIFNFYLN